jgi:hypothetical protein
MSPTPTAPMSRDQQLDYLRKASPEGAAAYEAPRRQNEATTIAKSDDDGGKALAASMLAMRRLEKSENPTDRKRAAEQIPQLELAMLAKSNPNAAVEWARTHAA